ncbi:TIGR03013 family XrtA/PEP-CTERM system glycosyltransferase [Thiomonas intermedia]|uniref:TIGR03013 family XrtA/PEP-CTERM system glycosyltransferase n=1 Tax=Thiomonas intermedia TaxID=926 RepID=UPI0009A4E9E0|nr:TIGR03013 family XrtA/PEP-CTERM system glycosyltransferase [Thiomonas intermedia]
MFKIFNLYIPAKMTLELLVDVAISILAFGLATWTVYLLTPGSHDFSYWVRQGSYPLVIYTGLSALLYTALGVYRIDAENSLRDLLGRTSVAFAFAFFPVYWFTLMFTEAGSSFRVLAFAYLYQMGFLILFRYILLRQSALSGMTRRILIVGNGREAQSLSRQVQERHGASYTIVGFYPTESGEQAQVQLNGDVFDGTTPLEQVVLEMRVDEIIIAVREQRGGVLPIRQLLEARILGTPVHNLPTFYERLKGEVPLESMKASWLIYGGGFTQGYIRALAKRLFDLFSACILLLTLWPIMLLAALAIKIEDRGPVFFQQERVGLFGKTFHCMKFRSMRTDAEKDGVARWASTNDNRITRVGAFMRKTRIDELPQLINVLRGEMSMVGPRPERPTFVDMLERDIPFYAIRHSVKPGVTGWAQVRYAYGASVEDSRRKLQFDLYYVKNNSVFLDFFILFETVRVVIFGEGAR